MTQKLIVKYWEIYGGGGPLAETFSDLSKLWVIVVLSCGLLTKIQSAIDCFVSFCAIEVLYSLPTEKYVKNKRK